MLHKRRDKIYQDLDTRSPITMLLQSPEDQDVTYLSHVQKGSKVQEDNV